MTVFDLYSKRKRRERGDFPDVYQYTFLPDEFRVQVMHILSDLYGCDQIRLIDKRENWFKGIHDALCREYGLLELNQGRNYQERVFSHLRAVADIDHAFDII